MALKIGVLAVQGAFKEHIEVLNKLGIETLEIRNINDAQQDFAGLILPGGESTTQGKLLKDLGIFKLLQERIKVGMPVYGSCAGMILLAKEIEKESQQYLAVMDITVRRNAFGRQSASFITQENFAEKEKITMPFIRAPYILSWGDDVEILSQVKGVAVAARENNILVTAFHPEVTGEVFVHEYFLEIVKNKVKSYC